MLKLTQSTRILLAVKPADFRKGLDGLLHYTQQLASNSIDTKSGVMVVFINRAKTMVRVISYDGSGYWLATKRISQGRFQHWPQSFESLTKIQSEQLITILQQLPKTKKERV